MAAAEQIAQAFHEAYERLVPGFQGEPKPWSGLPEHHRSAMVAAIQSLLDGGVIHHGAAPQERSDEDRIRDAMAEAHEHPGKTITR